MFKPMASSTSQISEPLRRGISQSAVSLIGAGLSSVFNLGSAIYTNWQNKKMAELQYERQRRDIAAQNAYNSPAAQIVRLRAAGINPAMAFQNGISASAGEQSAIAQYQRPEFSVPTLDSQAIVSAFTDVGRLENERALNEQKVRQLKSDIRLLDQSFDFNEKNNPNLIEHAKNILNQDKATLDKTTAEIEKVWSEAGLNKAKIKETVLSMGINYGQFCMAVARFPHEVWNMDSQTFLNYMTAHKHKQDIALGWASLREIKRHNERMEGIANYDSSTRRMEHYRLVDVDYFAHADRQESMSLTRDLNEYNFSYGPVSLITGFVSSLFK